MARRDARGPQFIEYFGPIVSALKELGGSGRPAEVESIIVERLRIPEAVQDELTATGSPRLNKRIHWARFYLARTGYIDSSVRGVWTLTDKGRDVDSFTHAEALEIFDAVTQQLKLEKAASQTEDPVYSEEADQLDEDHGDGLQPDYREEMLELLKALPPDGFERLCQRLLRESGFERVTVTGRSGDGGIDGIGVLQMTPFVSFKVLFQSKRYAGSVSAPQIRDFRGAMLGRAEKGIILTTGTFTRDARNEAARDGVEPIELVDGEELVSLFESLELGLKPRIAYDVDYDFFEQFQ
jgi:restriction system protein